MAREITGFSNPLVKRVRSLREKKFRKAEGLFLAEGLRILTEAREEGVLPEMLFHAGSTHPLAAELIEAWGADRAVSADGRLDWSDLAGLLHRARFFVGGGSAAMHHAPH